MPNIPPIPIRISRIGERGGVWNSIPLYRLRLYKGQRKYYAFGI